MRTAFSNCSHCHQSSREGGVCRHRKRGVNTELSSATSHFSPSWLRNGNGCQITGGFCRYQVCFKEVFLPRALASLMGLVRFAGIMLAISYHLELGLCEKCVDRKPKVAGEGQSWKKNRIGSSSSCGPKRVVGRLWGFLRIFPSCGAEKI